MKTRFNKGPSGRRARSYRRPPDFDCGVIAEPLLSFGGGHTHVDPKAGLGLYGPYSLAGQTRPALSTCTVGIIGTPQMLADASQWLQACGGQLWNDGSQPFLYPHFPGFDAGPPFQCELVHGETWRETLKPDDLSAALKTARFHERIKKVVDIYVSCIETLSQREPRPDVILCCIPREVVEFCTVRVTKWGEAKRVKKTKVERLAERWVREGKLFLFPEMDPTLGIEDEGYVHRNLRRGLKAEAMKFGIPTQLVWARTLEIASRRVSPGERPVQDIATRAWNFFTGLYHKAGGFPWRLAEVEDRTCFVGISFYKEVFAANPSMRTSMAQTFTAAGDGYVLRGRSFEWDESRHGKSPHLDRESAAALMRDVIDLYCRQTRGSLPDRIVVHKTSRYWREELDGFRDACQSVPHKSFVTVGWRGIQFYRQGNYPPIRGTYVKFSDTNLLLYTAGYVPFLRTYPGARVPQPIEILEHHGDSPWDVVLREILALTKMNWNTADFACREPITIAFSQRVGQILAELPQGHPMRPEYRFYM